MIPPELGVLYDISALGSVVEKRTNYTGVQRVVHEVARGLSMSREIELRLYAANFLPECEQFVSTDSTLRGCQFVHTQSQSYRSARIRALTASIRDGQKKRSIRHRAERWAASRFATMLRWRQSALSLSQLQRFDVYHTPVHAFPAAVRESRKIAKFQTIYDLTFIRMPQYADGANLLLHRRTMASVPEDAWILCISENTKLDWCEYTRTDPNRCFVTPLAAASYFAPCLDTDRIATVRRRYRIPEGDYFLSVSTLEPRKNLAAVIRTFQKLLLETNDPSLYLVLVGGRGWKEEGIFEAAEPVRSRIIFTGYVAEEDLSAIYSGALAFLYLSFYEGFGLPPLEAMQCGTPVIASNNSSLPEVVGSAGILLNPDDQDGLCTQMQRLREDAILRHTLSEQALERARLFSWRACVDRTVAAYRYALAQR